MIATFSGLIEMQLKGQLTPNLTRSSILQSMRVCRCVSQFWNLNLLHVNENYAINHFDSKFGDNARKIKANELITLLVAKKTTELVPVIYRARFSPRYHRISNF